MNLTLKLESELKGFMDSMKSVWHESNDIYKLYWSAGPSSELSALADGDAATNSTKLTKIEVVNGISLAENLKNFFGNAAVTQSDYLSYMENILYGNDQKSPSISAAVEALGNRLYSLSGTLLTLFNKSKALLDLYNDAEIAAAVAAISDHTIVFGANSSKSLFTSGITMLEQFKKMINNEVVTQADYASTLAKWEQVQ